MNWYKNNKIDTLVLEYWAQPIEKTAGLKDWWKENKEDFTDRPFSKGLWNVTKGSIRAVLGTLWNVVFTTLNVILPFVPSTGVWDDALTALKQTVKGIGETIYGLAQMGASGINTLKEYAVIAGQDIKKQTQEYLMMDDKLNPKTEKAADEAGEKVKEQIINFADHLESKAA